LDSDPLERLEVHVPGIVNDLADQLSIESQTRSLAAFLQPVGDSSYSGAERHFPVTSPKTNGPSAGLRAEAVSCFWIPQIGYGIPSPGDHVSPAGDVRFLPAVLNFFAFPLAIGGYGPKFAPNAPPKLARITPPT